ncbi:MAG: cyclic nucleotide-binding domain-containing protein [Chloroflexota bacterium]|nr:cyclic nucleotide-binding domain-containing protein [Chloroflexota bacterium]MXY80012.1 cyclic nucleotide-binding domain-containing protein [Chloroflexota bacterium]
MSDTFSFESMLAKTELFAGLDEAELGPFAAKCQLHTYEAGHEITREGDLGTGLYVVTRGAVDVVSGRGTPEERTITTTAAGGFFGELALVLEQPRSATVVTREFTECLVLTRWDFKDIALEHPAVIWKLLEVVAQRLSGRELVAAA